MDYQKVQENIKYLQKKYQLIDFNFDAESIHNLGDLSSLLQNIVDQTLSEKNINITEKISEDGSFFICTLTNVDSIIEIQADTHSDWLPDHFFDQLENIPKVFKSDKRFYSINPAIGLTGQDAWYFCGPEFNLKQARKEGLPLIFPGEDIMESPEFKKFNE